LGWYLHSGRHPIGEELFRIDFLAGRLALTVSGVNRRGGYEFAFS
jgi:hypothetical protein